MIKDKTGRQYQFFATAVPVRFLQASKQWDGEHGRSGPGTCFTAGFTAVRADPVDEDTDFHGLRAQMTRREIQRREAPMIISLHSPGNATGSFWPPLPFVLICALNP